MTLSTTTDRTARGATVSRRARRTARRGFTIVDLLVSITVVAILISILAPSLMQSYEMARRVVCSSNIRQLGFAMDMYLDDNAEKLPSSAFIKQGDSQNASSGTSESHNSIYVRIDTANDDLSDSKALLTSRQAFEQWDGLGVLFEYAYLTHPGVYYCPSHHGEHGFDTYEDQWRQRDGTIAGNYQYRIDSRYRHRSELPPELTLIADSMRTQDDYNHKVGNNLLRADLSVEWFQDVNGRIFNSLASNEDSPETLTSTVDDAWEVLDDGLSDPHSDQMGPLTAGSGN